LVHFQNGVFATSSDRLICTVSEAADFQPFPTGADSGDDISLKKTVY
jgi:hypothetical protein